MDACPPVPGALLRPPPAVVALQLLLFLPEAVGLTVQPGASEPPNGYVVCRLFCASRPPPATDVVWSSLQPQFNHRLVFPLALSTSLLSQLCSGVMVAEVWHKTPGTATEDQVQVAGTWCGGGRGTVDGGEPGIAPVSPPPSYLAW